MRQLLRVLLLAVIITLVTNPVLERNVFAETEVDVMYEVSFGSPIIDGEIDELWEKATVITPMIGQDNTDTTGTLRLLWDDNALYLLAEIVDADLNNDHPLPYEQDSIEVFLDEYNDKAAVYEMDDLHFRVNYLNERTADNGDRNRFYTQVQQTDTGYLVEARIAFLNSVSNEDVLGFEFQINDADANGSRKATINLFDETGNAYANPSLFGEIKLIGKTDEDSIGINRYDLLAYLDYVESINQAIYLNGSILNEPMNAAYAQLENENATQQDLDHALQALKVVVNQLRRSEVYEEPHRLPETNTLPDPFTFQDGTKVRSIEDWGRRAAEIKDMFHFYMYGYMPDTSGEIVSYEQTGDGLTIHIDANGRSTSFPVTVSLPDENSGHSAPYPVIVALGALDFAFWGPPLTDYEQQANDRGYAVITLQPNIIASDNYDRTGSFFELYPYSEIDNDIGALAAWAWGAGKVLDALELGAYQEINEEQSLITGFSRFGKAALVTGAFDDRFAIVNPHASGMGGMATYRYSFAGKEYEWGTAGSHEGLGNLQGSTEGHWFNSVFQGFENVYQLPVDQHQLASLVAPRSLLLTSGYEDYGTNPEGMYVAYVGASKVYEFLGSTGKMGVAFRPGGHSFNQEDLEHLLSFADLQFRGVESEFDFSSTVYEIDSEWNTIELPEPIEEEVEETPEEKKEEKEEPPANSDHNNLEGEDHSEETKKEQADENGDEKERAGEPKESNDDNDVNRVSEEVESESETLPNTATSLYNFLVIGILLLLAGTYIFLREMKKT